MRWNLGAFAASSASLLASRSRSHRSSAKGSVGGEFGATGSTSRSATMATDGCSAGGGCSGQYHTRRY